MLFALVLLVVPSIYGATVELRIEKRSLFSPVDLTRSDTRDLLNRARDSKCNPPQITRGFLKNCRATDRGAFPAKSAECVCSKCTDKLFKLFCNDDTWYLHPDHSEFPCKSCSSCTQKNKDFVCSSQQIGGVTSVMSDCTCVHDCLDYDIECGADSQWEQKTFLDSNGKSFVCNDDKKVMQLGNRRIDVDRGIITVTCEKGYKTNYHNKISCIKGIRNGTIPECISISDPGKGTAKNNATKYIVSLSVCALVLLLALISVLLWRKCRRDETSEVAGMNESSIYATPDKKHSSK